MASPEPKNAPRLRADARRNRDRLIRTAAEAFAERGAGASLEDIARRAGVGIGFCQTRLAARQPDLVHLFPDFRLTLQTFVAMHEDLKTIPRYRHTFDALVTGLRDYIAERQ